jgi:hypothetical protein
MNSMKLSIGLMKLVKKILKESRTSIIQLNNNKLVSDGLPCMEHQQLRQMKPTMFQPKKRLMVLRNPEEMLKKL